MHSAPNGDAGKGMRCDPVLVLRKLVCAPHERMFFLSWAVALVQ
jgi:hypothetical protein